MTSKDIVITAHRNMGKADAQALRDKAAAGELTDTEIIDSEQAVPEWRPDKDYTNAKVGTPVAFGDQVYGLIQPHNAAHFPVDSPAALPALWRVKHTTDPAKAKPWVQPTSTSDIYQPEECMLWTDGNVYRAKRATNYNPAEYAADWEEITI